ncbi:MAG TPA: hypothetical protein VGZ71_06230 [Puia sp.]|jgi:hypothetical protein|nr:hypothetical protein [Puia sp.]
MKNSLFLILLLAELAIGQKAPLSPLPKEVFRTPQSGRLMQADFLAGKKGPGDKNLQDRVGSRETEMAPALEGRFSHKTSNRSSVFIIQLDHMPCLVPERNSVEMRLNKLPGDFQSGDPMPNALPRVQTIPLPKKLY